MIVYFDTSAFVPLLVQERSSAACGQLWDEADDVATSRLTFVESAAALAAALRLDRVTRRQHDAARLRLTDLWQGLDLVELDPHLMLAAADATAVHALRGYDAVHFAAAATLEQADLVAATGDRRLLEAWRDAGITVADTNIPGAG